MNYVRVFLYNKCGDMHTSVCISGDSAYIKVRSVWFWFDKYSVLNMRFPVQVKGGYN